MMELINISKNNINRVLIKYVKKYNCKIFSLDYGLLKYVSNSV